MTLKQAIKIVEKHQRWRRDPNVPSKHKMVDVYELGKALDILLFIAKLEAKVGNTDRFHIHPREVIQEIKQWAKQRNLDTQDPKVQLSKLMEESGELARAILKDDPIEQIDAIGDITVVLIVLSMQLGLDYKRCVELAYNIIKDRKGKIVDGVYIKE